MPTYDYECASCGVFEVFQSIKDDAFKRCPQCGSRKIHRLISGGGGVIFKGDGFWETDYNRSNDYQKQAKQETGKVPAAKDVPAAPAPTPTADSSAAPSGTGVKEAEAPVSKSKAS